MALYDISAQALKEAEAASAFYLTVPPTARPLRGSSDAREGIWTEIVTVRSASYKQDGKDIRFNIECSVSPESPETVNHGKSFTASYNVFYGATDPDDWRTKVTQMNLPRLKSLYVAAGLEGDLVDDDGSIGFSGEQQESCYGPDSILTGMSFYAKIKQSKRKDAAGEERINTDVTRWSAVD